MRRSRFMHWTAWGMAVLALGILSYAIAGRPGPALLPRLALADVALSFFFVFEFFTRTGWRTHRARYVRWRWFDFVAMAPVVFLLPASATWATAIVWIVLACRAIRAVDRTLGDGFVQRQALVLVGAVEEEITDRVVDKILARWQVELDQANFGRAAAAALERNKDALLQRVFEEQLARGTFATIARYSGLRGSLEREEARLFEEFIQVVGSPDVDKAIRDVVSASFQRLRAKLGKRAWVAKLGRAEPETNMS